MIWTMATGVAFSQGPQNRDISFMVGVSPPTSQVVPNYGYSLSTPAAFALQYSFGYQLLSASAGNLYVEFPWTLSIPGRSGAGESPSEIRNSFSCFTPGIRFGIPVQSRVSIYAALGGGYGRFRRLTRSETTGAMVSRSTLQGVFEFGGGVDIRLTRFWSIRGEVRDFVSGLGLSGVAGRHHWIPLGGIALHF
jgi:opacity protein-like surface antigen